jgi:hypothetical protein
MSEKIYQLVLSYKQDPFVWEPVPDTDPLTTAEINQLADWYIRYCVQINKSHEGNPVFLTQAADGTRVFFSFEEFNEHPQ